MKKLITKKLLCAAVMLGIVGCTLTLAQKTAIAHQAGIGSAVTWIGADTPSPAQLDTAKDVVALIREGTCTNCSDSGSSYYGLLYPMADRYITEHVKAEDQAMARLGAAWLLTSIDTYFAMNPEFAEKQSEATQIAQAFCDGFSAGLAMTPTDPVVQAASRQAAVRVKLMCLR